MIETSTQLRALLRARGLAPLTGEGSLVDAIAGQHVKGSWWAHARGKLIFQLISALEEDEGVLGCKLLEGKVTFVDRALWPALARVVLDEGRRKDATRSLSPNARALLREVEKKGELTIDRARAKEKKELERALLVAIDQVHSASGAHVTRLRAWRRVLAEDVIDEGMRLDLEEAKRALSRR